MTPPPEICYTCKKRSAYHLANTFDNGNYVNCPWCHCTLSTGAGACTKAWRHQKRCTAQPSEGTPLCDCREREEIAYQEELARARARPSFSQRLLQYAPNLDYAKSIAPMPIMAVEYPPIPSCADCRLLIPFSVSASKPNCPWCWEWLYLGGGSLFHIYTHLRECPNRPLGHLVCQCSVTGEECFLDDVMESWN